MQFILPLDKIGHLIRYDYISSVVNDILKEDHKGDDPAPTILCAGGNGPLLACQDFMVLTPPFFLFLIRTPPYGLSLT